MSEITERFLVVRFSSLGDLVHTIPAVAALRSSFPNARIDWLVGRRWSPLVELFPCVDEVIAFGGSVQNCLSCVRRLRQRHYTCAVDFQNRDNTALLTWLSGAPRRIGRDRKAVREPGANWFYTERVNPTGRHIAEMNLSLAVHAGAKPPAEMQFPLRVPEDGSRRLWSKVPSRGSGAYFVVSPGGGWRSKCWPPERYGALCAQLWRSHGLRAVVNIAPGEEYLGEGVVNAAGPEKPLVFCPSLPELVALVADARLVVGADTGPVHLAAALGTRVVALFGATDPVRNGPLPRGIVVQNASSEPPNYKRGNYVRASFFSPEMLSLSIEQVLAAVEQELSFTA